MEHTLHEMKPDGSARIWNTLFGVAYRRVSRKRFFAAVCIVVLLHVFGYFGAPDVFSLLAQYVPAPQTSVVLVEPEKVVIPEDLLPEEFRKEETPEFVPANPNAPEQTPPETNLHSSVNRRAAQEDPDPTTRSRKPRNDGESESARGIAEDLVPQELLPEEMRMSRVAEEQNYEPDDGESPERAGVPVPESEAGKINVGQTDEARKPTPVKIPEPQERPRISVPSGLNTLTMKSNTATNEVGSVSLDAKFSEFGEYTQRMLESIQAAWYVTCKRSSVHSRGTVVVRFTLCSDGTIDRTEVVFSSASELATYACRDAIESRAPYEPWREEMIAFFGDEQTTTISFYYR